MNILKIEKHEGGGSGSVETALAEHIRTCGGAIKRVFRRCKILKCSRSSPAKSTSVFSQKVKARLRDPAPSGSEDKPEQNSLR